MTRPLGPTRGASGGVGALVALMALAVFASPAAAGTYRLEVPEGSSASATVVQRPGAATIRAGGSPIRLGAQRRVRLVASRERGVLRVTADGRRVLRSGASEIVVSWRGDAASVREVLRGRVRDPAVRLAHRLSLIREVTPPGRHYLGSGRDGRFRYLEGWTIGFVPGALWRLADRLGSGLLSRWALEETLRTAGRTGRDDHDRGFVYGRGAGTGLDLACQRGAPFGAGARRCLTMKRMVIGAARQLSEMASGNPAGAIPTSYTRCRHCRTGELDVIVDSLPNLTVMLHAAELTGQDEFRRTALRHALWVRDNHVRPDGSTIQSVHIGRANGEVLRRETHQGVSAASTWSRGQAWAIYGFAELAERLGDRRMLDAAVEVAEHWMRRLPSAAVPRYDFDAPFGAPLDSTAGSIAAAGFGRLAKHCAATLQCDARKFRVYGERLVRSQAAEVQRGWNLGKLDRGAYVIRAGDVRWDDRAELAFGLDFLAEALGG